MESNYQQLIRFAIICIVLFRFNTPLKCQSERISPNCPLHIIIAMDFSASERAFLDEIQTVLYAITSRFELHPNGLRIGLISFNRGAQLIMPLSGDTGTMIEAIETLRIPTRVYATDMHAGIELAYQEFRQNSITSIPKYFILVSDGDPHAHSRGVGYQEDISAIEKLKNGDAVEGIDPVHVFTIYSGAVSPYRNPFDEEVRIESVQHMQNLASNLDSFYYFKEYPALVDYFEIVSSCL